MVSPGPAIVRVLDGGGRPVGGGFLVTPDVVVTCAHVVSRALGAGTGTPPDGSGVEVDFPLHVRGRRFPARTVFARFDTADWSVDLAALRLVDPPVPGPEPLRLVEVEDVWQHGYRAFGFPPGRPDGVWTKGRLLDRLGHGLVQLSGDPDVEFHIDSGFSGTPLWDGDVEGAVGMVVAKEHSPAGRTAYALLATSLLEQWPQLREYVRPPCPYRGLEAFRESDRDVYFGREALAVRLAEHVRGHRIVALIGPSGVGKSSLVSAGLLPLLGRDGDLAVGTVRADPDATASRMLARALAPLLEPDLGQSELLTATSRVATAIDNGQLGEAVDMLLERTEARQLVVVVDQLEALLRQGSTAVADLVGLLAPAVDSAPGHPARVRLLLVLRSDFLDLAMTDQRLTRAWRSGIFLLTEMEAEQLRRAVEGPLARLRTVSFEPGLVDRIIADAGDGPNRLPLVQFVLTRLWEEQAQGLLTNEAYQRLGGVGGALARYAEQVWREQVDDGDDDPVGRLFVRLVRPGTDGLPDTRVPVRRDEVDPALWTLAETLVTTRLLVPARAVDGEPTVVLAHEALIERWQRLARWVDADREFRGWQEQLRQGARRWEAQGRRPADLLHRSGLVDAQRWLAARPGDLSAADRLFIEASRTRLRRVRRARLALLAAVLALVVLATGGALYALRARSDVQASQAEQRSRDLVALGQAARDPVTRALLAVAAYRTSPTPAAVGFLLSQYLQHQFTRSVGRPDLSASAQVSNDGGILAWYTTPDSERERRVEVRAQPPRPSRTLMSVDGVTAFGLNPDGTRLAVGGADGRVRLFDTGRGALTATLTMPAADGPPTPIAQLMFDPDGKHLAARASQARSGAVWDLTTGDLHPVRSPTTPPGLLILTGFDHSGNNLYANASADEIAEYAWRTSDGAPANQARPVTADLQQTGYGVVAVRCSGPRPTLAVLDPLTGAAESGVPQGIPCNQSTGLLDISARAVLTIEGDPRSPAVSQAFTPGLDTAETAAGPVLRLWDRAHGTAWATLPIVANNAGYRVSDDGRQVTATGTGAVLTVPPPGGIDPTTGTAALATTAVLGFAGSAQHVAVAVPHRVAVYDRDTAALLGSATFDADALVAPAISPDGTVLAGFVSDHAVRLYRLPSLRPVADLAIPMPRSLTSVPDYARSLSFCSGSILGVLSAGTITTWSTATGTPTAAPMVFDADAAAAIASGHPLTRFACRPGTAGQYAIPSVSGGAVEIWDATSRGRVGLVESDPGVPIEPLWFSADGRHLLTADRDTPGDAANRLELWDLDSGHRLARLSSPSQLLNPPSGQLPVMLWDLTTHAITTVRSDGTVTGSLSATATGFAATATTVSRDGTVLVLHRDDIGEYVLVPTDPVPWARHLCQVLGRTLTGPERDTLSSALRTVRSCDQNGRYQ
jgi:WD40 repeat protein